MEVFGDLGKEDREQVWGMTFRLDEHTGASDGITEFSREFDRLEKRLNEQLLGRLQQERDLQKRALIFAFLLCTGCASEWTRHELYFGLSRDENGTLVRIPESEWSAEVYFAQAY